MSRAAKRRSRKRITEIILKKFSNTWLVLAELTLVLSLKDFFLIRKKVQKSSRHMNRKKWRKEHPRRTYQPVTMSCSKKRIKHWKAIQASIGIVTLRGLTSNRAMGTWMRRWRFRWRKRTVTLVKLFMWATFQGLRTLQFSENSFLLILKNW